MRILILSRQPSLFSTQRLSQAGRSYRHKMHVLDPLGFPVVFKNNIEQVSAPFDAMIPRIGASITAYGCSVVRHYESQGVWSLNPSQSIILSRDKLTSLQLLHGHQIPVPKTAVVSDPSSLNRAISAVGGLPVVLKMRQGTQGRGVVLVRTLSAARHAYSVLNDFQQYTLVQEYIQEAHNKDIRVIVVGDRAIAAMERQAPSGDFRANIHRGGSATPFKMPSEIANLAVKAARLHGLLFSGVDLIMTRQGPAVIELNSSPGLRGIETTTGADIASQVIRFIETQVSADKSFTNETLSEPKVSCDVPMSQV